MNCKYCDDYTGICAKPECPMCGDCCPVPDVEGVCKFEERRTSMATEKRLIDANALLREVMEGHPYEGLSMAAQVCTMELLTYAPTVDAVEVVHGRWEKHGKHDWRCSNCKIGVPYSYTGHKYCPNCGAKMDLKGD